MKQKVLVTGATGFMGKRLVKGLIAEKYDVSVFVRNEMLARNEFGDACKIIVGDITKPETLTGVFESIDIVYHLAALMGHDLPSEEAFAKFRAINVQGTVNVVNECKRADIKRFIHVSSTAAMGLLTVPVVNEETNCAPYTPYQVTKFEGEQFVLEEYKTNAFPAVILRPSMVYGPGFKGDFLTMAKVCKTGFFPKIGMGENLSPALFISDLTDALLLFAQNGKLGEVYLLSSEKSYTLKETALIIGGALNKKIHFIYAPVWLALFGAWMLEKISNVRGKHVPVTRRNIRSMVTDRVFDVRKAQKVGFQQSISLEVGLKETVQYFCQQKFI
jgi:nucleoside-diphosphate-sugar epimerase